MHAEAVKQLLHGRAAAKREAVVALEAALSAAASDCTMHVAFVRELVRLSCGVADNERLAESFDSEIGAVLGQVLSLLQSSSTTVLSDLLLVHQLVIFDAPLPESVVVPGLAPGKTGAAAALDLQKLTEAERRTALEALRQSPVVGADVGTTLTLLAQASRAVERSVEADMSPDAAADSLAAVDGWVEAWEVALAACTIHIPKVDRKEQRHVQFQHLRELAAQLESATQPQDVLFVTASIVLQKLHSVIATWRSFDQTPATYGLAVLAAVEAPEDVSSTLHSAVVTARSDAAMEVCGTVIARQGARLP